MFFGTRDRLVPFSEPSDKQGSGNPDLATLTVGVFIKNGVDQDFLYFASLIKIMYLV